MYHPRDVSQDAGESANSLFHQDDAESIGRCWEIIWSDRPLGAAAPKRRRCAGPVAPTEMAKPAAPWRTAKGPRRKPWTTQPLPRQPMFCNCNPLPLRAAKPYKILHNAHAKVPFWHSSCWGGRWIKHALCCVVHLVPAHDEVVEPQLMQSPL